MGYIKIIFNGWTDNSLLYNVKRIKEITGWGLREAKDYTDLINSQMKNKTLLIDENDGHFHLLKRFMVEGLFTFELEGNPKIKPENKRVVAKRSKEYEKAKAWVDSLHPKKQAMIKLLIQEENGI